MQNTLGFLTLIFTAAFAGYSGSYSGNFVDEDGTNGGYGYGYGGPFPPGFPQQFFQQIPFSFNNFLEGYLSALNKHHQTLTDNLQQLQQTIQKQAADAQNSATSGVSLSRSGAPVYSGYGSGGYGGAVDNYGSYGGGFGGSYGGGGYGGSFSHASGVPGGYGVGASASVGKGQVQQTAFLKPENPASPNVNVRFAETPTPNGKSYAVFTSSSSGSGNVNGKPYGFRRAQTTVNDNGKVSTYTVTD